jgi:hypothetical protein
MEGPLIIEYLSTETTYRPSLITKYYNTLNTTDRQEETYTQFEQSFRDLIDIEEVKHDFGLQAVATHQFGAGTMLEVMKRFEQFLSTTFHEHSFDTIVIDDVMKQREIVYNNIRDTTTNEHDKWMASSRDAQKLMLLACEACIVGGFNREGAIRVLKDIYSGCGRYDALVVHVSLRLAACKLNAGDDVLLDDVIEYTRKLVKLCPSNITWNGLLVELTKYSDHVGSIISIIEREVGLPAIVDVVNDKKRKRHNTYYRSNKERRVDTDQPRVVRVRIQFDVTGAANKAHVVQKVLNASNNNVEFAEIDIMASGDNTNAIVINCGRRTTKVMYGIATGALIVDGSWVEDCITMQTDSHVPVVPRSYIIDEFRYALEQYSTEPQFLEERKFYIVTGVLPDVEEPKIKKVIVAFGGEIVDGEEDADHVITLNDTLTPKRITATTLFNHLQRVHRFW